VDELRALLAEGSAWLTAEGTAGTGLARRALDELEAALARGASGRHAEGVVAPQTAV
jgi:hypothetical protein